MKKWLSVAICLLMLVSMVPMGVFNITASAAFGDVEVDAGDLMTPPDCETEGHTYDDVCDPECNVCEEPRVAPHDYDWVVDTPADCGNDGEQHEECTLCHTKRNENTPIPATGEHDYDWVVDTPADCGNEGKKHEECSVCEAKRNENTPIPAPGEHDFSQLNYKYDDDGHWLVCDCGAADEKEQHSFSDYRDDEQHGKVCICGKKIDLEAHDFNWVVDEPADCGNEGEKHEECTGCYMTRNEGTPIPATGEHQYDDDADAECNVCHAIREVVKNGWAEEGGKKLYYVNGVALKNEWEYIGGKWYFFDADGYMLTNKWQKDSKGWVYVGADGAMKTNAWVKDSKGWCYVGADGYAVTNCWKKDSKGWIYLDSNGSMTKSKWVKDGGKWYYCDANGYMVAGKSMKIGSKTYNFNASGVCTNP